MNLPTPSCRNGSIRAGGPGEGPNGSGSPAFTFLELLVILAVLALGALLLVPALARTQPDSRAAACRNNLGQLCRGWLMYANDNNDFLPPNPDDGNTSPNFNWVGGQAGVGGGNEFDPNILKDPSRSLLAPYQGKNISIYHCPADMRLPGIANGTSAADPSLMGTRIPNARSISMNQAVGTNPYKGRGTAAVDGPWLDGNHGHTANKTWYTYGKLVSMVKPGPANTFVFVDENKYSINDGGFATVGPAATPNYRMVDWPGIYHNGACGFAFGDGHSEIHKWKDPRTYLLSGAAGVPSQAGNQDIWWMSVKSTALIAGPGFGTP